MEFTRAVLAANREIFSFLQTADDSLFQDGGQVGFGGDKSLLIDLIAEKIFIKHLSGFGRINSEECGLTGSGRDEIVIDPIDGSSNAASGFPYYGTSVALKSDNKVAASVVCNMTNGEYFYKNSSGIYHRQLFDDRVLSVNREGVSSVGLFEKAYSFPREAKKLRKMGFKFRSPGALALSLAYAHSVRFVVAAGKLREYDIIAGLHLCEDLNVFVSERLIIISREKTVFDRLKAGFTKEVR
ncbi:MAG: inositol monophosphatase [Helicobacteraceae bacterium]|jgi:myo-inositol-1(or 4)-monophosphatase|nr:inositol monophosphatase [Helicobacteraceae bacterium]